MDIRKIVVGADFSEASRAAIEASIDLGRKAGAEVVLVRATVIPDYDHLQLTPRSRWKRAQDELVRGHREKLSALRERYDGQGVEISHVLIDDVPARGILRAAAELDADVVAVGNRGRSAATRFLLGNVAEKVVRHAKASVLVGRPRREGRRFRHRILVPTDFSPAAELALATAASLAGDDGDLELLHCLSVPSEIAALWAEAGSPPKPNTVSIRDALTGVAKRDAAALLQKYARDNVRFRSIFNDDAAREGIRRRLANGDYDLVVVGSRGHAGVKRWLLGSVAEATVRHAPCSVLVVREKEWNG